MLNSRPVTFASGALSLEGILHLPDGPHRRPASWSATRTRSTAATCTTTSSTPSVRPLSRTASPPCASTSAGPDSSEGRLRQRRGRTGRRPRRPRPISASCPKSMLTASPSPAIPSAPPWRSTPLPARTCAPSSPSHCPRRCLSKASLLACPALFVSGDEDEYSDADDLTEFVRGLGPQARAQAPPRPRPLLVRRRTRSAGRSSRRS